MTRHTGFTLIELLLAIGIIGILASTVIVAINPTKMLSRSKDAARLHDLKQIENAVLQALIDGQTIPALPFSIGAAQDICTQSVTGTDCTTGENGIDLAFLAPDFLASIPVDPDEHGGRITGYRIYKIGAFYRACSPVLDPTCGGPYSPGSAGSSSSTSEIPDPPPSSSASSTSTSSSSSATSSSSSTSASSSSSTTSSYSSTSTSDSSSTTSSYSSMSTSDSSSTTSSSTSTSSSSSSSSSSAYYPGFP